MPMGPMRSELHVRAQACRPCASHAPLPASRAGSGARAGTRYCGAVGQDTLCGPAYPSCTAHTRADTWHAFTSSSTPSSPSASAHDRSSVSIASCRRLKAAYSPMCAGEASTAMLCGADEDSIDCFLCAEGKSSCAYCCTACTSSQLELNSCHSYSKHQWPAVTRRFGARIRAQFAPTPVPVYRTGWERQGD